MLQNGLTQCAPASTHQSSWFAQLVTLVIYVQWWFICILIELILQKWNGHFPFCAHFWSCFVVDSILFVVCIVCWYIHLLYSIIIFLCFFLLLLFIVSGLFVYSFVVHTSNWDSSWFPSLSHTLDQNFLIKKEYRFKFLPFPTLIYGHICMYMCVVFVCVFMCIGWVWSWVHGVCLGNFIFFHLDH